MSNDVFDLRFCCYIFTDAATVQCDICGKMFKTENDVKRHKKTQHMGVYRYRCHKCGHGMEKRSYLKNHQCGRVRRKVGGVQNEVDLSVAAQEESLILATETIPVQYEVVMPGTWTSVADNSVVSAQPDAGGEFKYVDQEGGGVTILQNYEHLAWGNAAKVVDLPRSQAMLLGNHSTDPNTAYVQLGPTVYATSAQEETMLSIQQPAVAEPQQIIPIDIVPAAIETNATNVTTEETVVHVDTATQSP